MMTTAEIPGSAPSAGDGNLTGAPPGEPRRSSFALRPVVDIGDRRAVAYDVLWRGPEAGLHELETQLFTAAVIVSPAVLIVPAARPLVGRAVGRLAAHSGMARSMGAEIVWAIPTDFGVLSKPSIELAEELTARGYRVAIEGVNVTTLGHPELVEIQPLFAMVGVEVATSLLTGQAGRATVSALLAYFSRLGGRVVGRGADDAARARSMLEVGLKLATGDHLEAPVVLDADTALPGEEVVDRAWFRQRAVSLPAQSGLDPRGVPASGERARPPVSVSAIPASSGSADDREFARVLGSAARSLQAEHDPGHILETLADLLPRVVPVDRLAIFEADWEHYQLLPRIAKGEGLEGLGELDDSLDNGITGWAFLRGEPYNCPDTYAHDEAAHVPGTAGGRVDESLVIIPLIAGDHQLGALDLWRDGLDRFTEEDVERCALFGYLAAAAWRNAQLYGELEHRAVTDTLTGLLNTRWWEELGPREAAQAQRAGASIAVLLVDLDHFKRVNDTSGHAAGDQVLRNAARALVGSMRTGDAAVRFGGDEFLVLLHDSDLEGAVRVAESIRQALSVLPPPADDLPVVTASIGISLFPEHGSSLDEVVRSADRAMYEAKADGRDRVRVYTRG